MAGLLTLVWGNAAKSTKRGKATVNLLAAISLWFQNCEAVTPKILRALEICEHSDASDRADRIGNLSAAAGILYSPTAIRWFEKADRLGLLDTSQGLPRSKLNEAEREALRKHRMTTHEALVCSADE
jgi:hypothetical protein